jgi:hypothetical protein
VQLGAVVLIPPTLPNESHHPPRGDRAGSSMQPLPLWPIVGRNLVQEWINRIRRVGVEVLSITHRTHSLGPDPALGLARNGVEQFLVISLQSYAEIDLLDFLRYHRERRSTATAAFNQDGPLGVEVLSRTSLTFNHAAAWNVPADNVRTSEYRFDGYAKHLRSAKGYRDLVTDALSRQCALTPRGSQFGPATWVSENAKIGRGVRFDGPCFVGSDTILHEGVTLGPFTSVEDGCVIECGTMIEGSTVLPQTFLAAGLSVRRAVVDGSQLEQIDSGIVADLGSAGLARRLPLRGKANLEHDGGRRGCFLEMQPSYSGTATDTPTRVAARNTICPQDLASAP